MNVHNSKRKVSVEAVSAPVWCELGSASGDRPGHPLTQVYQAQALWNSRPFTATRCGAGAGQTGPTPQPSQCTPSGEWVQETCTAAAGGAPVKAPEASFNTDVTGGFCGKLQKPSNGPKCSKQKSMSRRDNRDTKRYHNSA